MVTDVTEESDHKTLKTNKQTNLKNRHHIHNPQHACPGILAGVGVWTQQALMYCASCEWSIYTSLDLLEKRALTQVQNLTLSFLQLLKYCQITQAWTLSSVPQSSNKSLTTTRDAHCTSPSSGPPLLRSVCMTVDANQDVTRNQPRHPHSKHLYVAPALGKLTELGAPWE